MSEDDDKKAIEGVVEPHSPPAAKPKGFLRQRIDSAISQVNSRANTKLMKEQTAQAGLARDMAGALATTKRTLDAFDNIPKEIAEDAARLEANKAEHKVRQETAEARSKEVIGDHEKRASQAKAEKLEADLRVQRLEQQLESEKDRGSARGKPELEADVDATRVRLSEIADEQAKLLMEDNEESLAKRRVLTAEKARLETRLHALEKKLLELDGLA